MLIMGVLILSLLAIGLSAGSKSTSTEDYFLAGRSLSWHQIGFSLFATNFSASALIGLTGAAYITGIAIYNYEWVGIFAILFFALVLVAVVRGSRVYTIAQYLNERYDQRVKTLYSVFIIFLIVFVDMAASLYAGGLLLSELIPGLSMPVVVMLVMGLAAVYSLVGGLQAISRTDVFQSFIILIGAMLIAYFTFARIGGWSELKSGAPDQFLSLIRPVGDRAVPWTGLIIGIPILGAYFWLVNQNMVQWVLSARTQADARRGLLLAGALKTLVLFIIILPGVAAIGLFPELSEPDRIYPALLLELLPVGVLGFVLAGFVAALMSNTDSTLHAASTIISMDFVRASNADISPQSLVKVGRITTVTIIVISAIWAPMIGRFGTLFEYIQGLLSYAVAPFVVVYLGGLFWPRATSNGAIAALVLGLFTAIMIGVLKDGYHLFELHYLHVPLPVTLVSLTALIGVSLTEKTYVEDTRLIWQPCRADAKDAQSYKTDVWLALLLGLLVLAQVWVFR